MTEANSARNRRAACMVAAALSLLALLALAGIATATTSTSSADPMRGITVSLEQSGSAVPLDGDIGFTGVIRLPDAASSLQARLQVRRIGGRLIYQRTQYLSTATAGLHTFSFSRPLQGLDLPTGTYPTTFTLRVTLADGSDVSTEVPASLRVWDDTKPKVGVVLVAKVHARPLVDPQGSFSVDPSSTVGDEARLQADAVANAVLADPNARITLAISPVAVEEWKRFATSGYQLASGTVVPPSDATPVAYADTLAHLQQALATGRLELATMGYADPNLADLATNKLGNDVGPQYDAGFSAIFTSLETTPAGGTVPAGGCASAAQQKMLMARRVTYLVADGDSLKIGKHLGVPSGAYRSAETSLTELVVDAKASRGIESADASAALADSFSRTGAPQPQPLVLRIDLEHGTDATAAITSALSAFEQAPWARLGLGSQMRPPRGAKRVTAYPQATRNAPAGYWQAVRSARARGTGMLAVLTASDDDASYTQTRSLLAEASEWSEPAAKWASAAAGLGYANAAIDRANSTFGAIKVSASPITLSGASGKIPVNIQNGSKKTLTVVVVVKTSTGVDVIGSKAIVTKLPPSETFIQIPVQMDAALFGRVIVQVMAGSVVVAKQTVQVRRSYLDRLAMIGGIVIVMGGMLVWIVLRVRRSPDVIEFDEDGGEESAQNIAEEPEPLAEDGLPVSEQVTQRLPVTDDGDAQDGARYTGANPVGPPDDRGGE